MNFIESMKMAFSSILGHKLRSILTMIGIMIGVGSVITVVAIGQGGEAALKSQFVGKGNNSIDIHYQIDEDLIMNMDPAAFYEPRFKERDIYELERIPEVSRVIYSNSDYQPVYYRDKESQGQLTGVTNGFTDIRPLTILEGRNLTETDLDGARKVAIISEATKNKLFGEESPIGEMIEVNNTPFKVVGVFKEESGGMLSFFGTDETIVPISLWPMMYGKLEIQSLTLKAKDGDSIELAGQKAVNLLNGKSEFTDGSYEVMNFQQIQDSIASVTRITTAIIAGIAGISLLVGGIGVMNIMLVSVTERTREIGIRKALGATRKNILIQFLIESMTLTLLGGSVGIALGTGGAYLVSYFAKWPPLVSFPVVLGGVLFSMVIGIIFGILPANKAAKMDPIEALRYE